MTSLLLSLLLVVAPAAAAHPASAPDASPRLAAPAVALAPAADSSRLVGTWVLVEQRGYGPNHPGDVEQTLVFGEDGRMTNTQTSGGKTTEMVLGYRVEGDRIQATVESVRMDGEPLDLGASRPEQSFRWRVEGPLLILGEPDGPQDVYRRAD